MDALRTGGEESGSVGQRMRRWLAAIDRGWKATLLGLVIVLAVGLL